MLKKTITFTDYNGVKRTEDHYFHLNKAELTEMELSEDGGMENKLMAIVQAKDRKQIIAIFKDVLLRAYGVKSPDGRRFIKSPELSKEFSQTEAYVELYMELATNDKAAAEFVNGVIPQSLAEQAKDVDMIDEAPEVPNPETTELIQAEPMVSGKLPDDIEALIAQRVAEGVAAALKDE